MDYNALITPATIVAVAGGAWKFLSKLVSNHLTHMKDEIVSVVKAGVAEENAGHERIVASVNTSKDAIVQAILTINH